MRIAILIICTLLASATVTVAQDKRPIGLVKTATGEAFMLRDGRRIAVLPGQQLIVGDVISTGANGTMGVILLDDTAMSLGPSTETGLEQFAFEPAEQKLGMVLRVTKGLLSYLSGRISKLAPGSVRIETPVATLGIRGTRLIARIVP